MMVTQKSESTVESSAQVAMNSRMSLREFSLTRSTSQPTSRMPHFVFITTTGRQKMATAKNTALLAKPPVAPAQLGAMPSNSISTMMSRPVAPSGIGVVIQSTASVSSSPTDSQP